MKYKHIILTREGRTRVLQVKEDDIPEPGAGEVRIKILAAGVALGDVYMRHGKYPGMPCLPFTPGYDMVGEVEACGALVKEFAAGQRVAALTCFGGYSQYICLPAKELIPVSKSVDSAEAVCLVLNYVTAYQMLHRLAHVKPGERILVHSAAGGVGTALLQLGKLVHLDIYGTTSTAKQALVAALGATPIDYKTENFKERVIALTGDGVDVVFDPIGGSHIRYSFQSLRKGGRLIIYGLSTLLEKSRNLLLTVLEQFFYIMLQLPQLLPPSSKRIKVYSVTAMKDRYGEWFREDLMTLLSLLEEKKIAPLVAERLPLEQAAHAHELLEQARVQGKLVLLPNL